MSHTWNVHRFFLEIPKIGIYCTASTVSDESCWMYEINAPTPDYAIIIMLWWIRCVIHHPTQLLFVNIVDCTMSRWHIVRSINEHSFTKLIPCLVRRLSVEQSTTTTTHTYTHTKLDKVWIAKLISYLIEMRHTHITTWIQQLGQPNQFASQTSVCELERNCCKCCI